MGDIRLDKSKPYSENRGDMQPDDPHYSVVFWQGEKMKTKDARTGKQVTITVVLPFDAAGNLVPDDGKTEPWQGRDAEGKPITHHPLWTTHMRELLKKKQERSAKIEQGNDEEDEGEIETVGDLSNEVNFVAWLKGEANYEWPLLQVAARQRFSRMFMSKKEMVVDLVLDEKLIPVDQLARELVKHLPAKEEAA